jgi:hypothetical protein
MPRAKTSYTLKAIQFSTPPESGQPPACEGRSLDHGGHGLCSHRPLEPSILLQLGDDTALLYARDSFGRGLSVAGYRFWACEGQGSARHLPAIRKPQVRLTVTHFA